MLKKLRKVCQSQSLDPTNKCEARCSGLVEWSTRVLVVGQAEKVAATSTFAFLYLL